MLVYSVYSCGCEKWDRLCKDHIGLSTFINEVTVNNCKKKGCMTTNHRIFREYEGRLWTIKTPDNIEVIRG